MIWFFWPMYVLYIFCIVNCLNTLAVSRYLICNGTFMFTEIIYHLFAIPTYYVHCPFLIFLIHHCNVLSQCSKAYCTLLRIFNPLARLQVSIRGHYSLEAQTWHCAYPSLHPSGEVHQYQSGWTSRLWLDVHWLNKLSSGICVCNSSTSTRMSTDKVWWWPTKSSNCQAWKTYSIEVYLSEDLCHKRICTTYYSTSLLLLYYYYYYNYYYFYTITTTTTMTRDFFVQNQHLKSDIHQTTSHSLGTLSRPSPNPQMHSTDLSSLSVVSFATDKLWK